MFTLPIYLEKEVKGIQVSTPTPSLSTSVSYKTLFLTTTSLLISRKEVREGDMETLSGEGDGWGGLKQISLAEKWSPVNIIKTVRPHFCCLSFVLPYARVPLFGTYKANCSICLIET